MTKFFSIGGLYENNEDERIMIKACLPAVCPVLKHGARYDVHFPTSESLAHFLINLMAYDNWDYDDHSESVNSENSPEAWIGSIADYYNHMELWQDVDGNIHGYTNDDESYTVTTVDFIELVGKWDIREDLK